MNDLLAERSHVVSQMRLHTETTHTRNRSLAMVVFCTSLIQTRNPQSQMKKSSDG